MGCWEAATKPGRKIRFALEKAGVRSSAACANSGNLRCSAAIKTGQWSSAAATITTSGLLLVKNRSAWSCCSRSTSSRPAVIMSQPQVADDVRGLQRQSA